MLASSYQQSHQDSLTYTDEEVNAYYAEHTNELDTFGYSVFTIQAAVQEETDEEGNPVEKSDEEKAAEFETAKADALALAQELQAKLTAGSDSQALAEEYGAQGLQLFRSYLRRGLQFRQRPVRRLAV